MRKMKNFICVSFVLAACVCAAQEEFVEAVPPKGVVNGYIQAKGRFGALVKGRGMVYANDIFNITWRGNRQRWKVLELTADQKRFARDVSTDNLLSVPGDVKPNFDKLVVMLENDARKYKAASTKLLKEDVLKEARKNADLWCSNKVICVKGELQELDMTGDNEANIRLKNVDCGGVDKKSSRALYIDAAYKVRILIKREQALGLKAGDSVILSGKSVFYSGALNTMANALSGKIIFTQFRMPGDSAMIGALELRGLRYDIFDPENETVKSK